MGGLTALAASMVLLAPATVSEQLQIKADGWTHLVDEGNNIVFTQPGEPRATGRPEIWMRMELIQPYLEAGKSYYAIASLVEVDCTEGRAQRLSITAHTQHNLQGEVSNVLPNAGWNYAQPGSIMHRLVQRACGQERQPESASPIK